MKLFTVVELSKSTLYNLEYARLDQGLSTHCILDKSSLGVDL